MRILIVDDDKATRVCLSRVLESVGEVVVAGSGQEALDAFGRALDEGRPFQLVSMDIVMPGLDGQATLQALRELEKRHGVAPGLESKVVMITGCGDTGNVSTAFFGGQADGYVQKPLRLDSLLEALRQMGFQVQ